MKGLLIDLGILVALVLVSLVVGLCRAAGKASRAEESGAPRDANPPPPNHANAQGNSGQKTRNLTRKQRARIADHLRQVNGGRR